MNKSELCVLLQEHKYFISCNRHNRGHNLNEEELKIAGHTRERIIDFLGDDAFDFINKSLKALKEVEEKHCRTTEYVDELRKQNAELEQKLKKAEYERDVREHAIRMVRGK